MAIDKVRVDESFYYSTPGTTNDEGKIEIISNNVEISNTYNGASMFFKCNTIGGIPQILAELSPDSSTNGILSFLNDTFVIGSSTQVTMISKLGTFLIANESFGSNVVFQLRNGSGVAKQPIIINPNTETITILAIVGTGGTLAADSDAVDVKGKTHIMVDTSGGNIIIGGLANGANGQTIELIKSNIANNMIIENNEGTGTQKMLLSTNADQTYSNYGGPKLRLAGSFWYEVGAQP